jgi:hypothetical protein
LPAFLGKQCAKLPDLGTPFVELGFDISEISTGFITMPTDDLLRLVEQVRKAHASDSERATEAPRYQHPAVESFNVLRLQKGAVCRSNTLSPTAV